MLTKKLRSLSRSLSELNFIEDVRMFSFDGEAIPFYVIFKEDQDGIENRSIVFDLFEKCFNEDTEKDFTIQFTSKKILFLKESQDFLNLEIFEKYVKDEPNSRSCLD